MTVKELKEFLKDCRDDCEIFIRDERGEFALAESFSQKSLICIDDSCVLKSYAIEPGEPVNAVIIE